MKVRYCSEIFRLVTIHSSEFENQRYSSEIKTELTSYLYSITLIYKQMKQLSNNSFQTGYLQSRKSLRHQL